MKLEAFSKMLIFVFIAVSGSLFIASRMNIARVEMPVKPALLNEPVPSLKGSPLSIDEVGRLAMLGSLHIRVLELDLESRQTDLLKARSRYDTRIQAAAGYEHVTEQQPSIVFGDRTIKGSADLSIKNKTPVGLETEIYYDNNRNSTNSSFSSLSRNYESHAGVRLRQPLIQNFFGTLDRGEVNLVRLDIQRFEEETLDQIEKRVFQARSAYWDYYKAVAYFRTRERGYELAKDFWILTRDQLEVGQSEEPDFYAAEANLRRRTQDLLQAHLEARMAMNRLKLELSDLKDVVPVNEAEVDNREVDLGGLLSSAMEHRRDLQKKLIDIRARGIEVKLNRNKLWPSLDVLGTYGSNALDRDQKNAQGEIFGFNHPTYFLGFELNVPLENRFARAEAKRARKEQEKAAAEFEQLQMQVSVEVENAYKEFIIGREVAEQAVEVERLNREKLQAEMKQFRAGRSSSKVIIDYQNDLLAAERDNLDARVNHEKSKDRLLLVQNRLLEMLGLTQNSERPDL